MFMTATTLPLVLLTMIIPGTHSGPLAYTASQTGCNKLWVACVVAAGNICVCVVTTPVLFSIGGVTGVSTGGAGVPAAILGCNSANGVCMATCTTVVLLAPTP